MASIKIAYAASAAVPITLASLASSSTLLTGQESDAVDNTTGLYVDRFVGGRITTGTAPTAGTIEVWAVGMIGEAPTWPSVFDGTNSAETIPLDAIKFNACRPVALLTTDATANRNYDFGPVSVAALFGGAMPKKVAYFVTHSTVAALNGTAANHYIHDTPAYYTSV